MEKARENCHRCRHFKITWNRHLPYGCQAFGFQSKQYPQTVVRGCSGAGCRLFEPKSLKK